MKILFASQRKSLLILQIRKTFDNPENKFGVVRASACLNIADNIDVSWHSLVQTARQTAYVVSFRLNGKTSIKATSHMRQAAGLSLRRKREQQSLCRQVCDSLFSNLYLSSLLSYSISFLCKNHIRRIVLNKL